jgi:hypothetical protein
MRGFEGLSLKAKVKVSGDVGCGVGRNSGVSLRSSHLCMMHPVPIP